nr:hypothetical protein [Mycobacterium lepromatosis]
MRHRLDPQWSWPVSTGSIAVFWRLVSCRSGCMRQRLGYTSTMVDTDQQRLTAAERLGGLNLADFDKLVV